MTEGYDRISMHGVRGSLLEQQVNSLGFPLHKIYISQKASNEEYETKMAEALGGYKSEGVEQVAFGDIFLEDLKRYREKNLEKLGFKGVFPIWKKDTRALIQSFINLGYQAFLSCVDTHVLESSFAGRAIDSRFLADLPKNVDPCGENGEYHSFVFNGPIFKNKVNCTPGKSHTDGRFFWRDLL